MIEENNLATIPVGPLGIVSMKSCEELGKRVDAYISSWRNERENEHKHTIAFAGYQKDSYLIDAKISRFGSGEAKGSINESVRGKDLYIMTDVTNYNLTYSLCGLTNHMSPDDHFQDLIRIIAAAAGKGKRITVIMPFLYESRQHKRTGRESLDCAVALQELVNLGVENIITFDAHDPRVQNAIPFKGFETVQPAYQFVKGLLRNVKDLEIDSDHLMMISPDEGGMGRAIYLANVLGIDMGMFYKRRDYSKIVDGRNPIVAHEFLGSDVEGKDVFIVYDMISSGGSMFDCIEELNKYGVAHVYVCVTYALFTRGIEKFKQYFEEKKLSGVYTTNLSYIPEEYKDEKWLHICDVSEYLAEIIYNIHNDLSISTLMTDKSYPVRLLEEKFTKNN